MLVAVAPTQPVVPLEQVAIVRKVVPAHSALPHRRLHRRHRRHHHQHRRVVYHLAEASWYGGGGTLACGGTLTSWTLGVANKTLPCGTWITLRYRGRQLRVRVIDRGPYVAGREFDLTEATKRALGFGDLGEVWWSMR
jgi:rare lipoprotein A (peptidoglycan hydrolase)